uniref:Uncharacterized protein n=1 Tax=Ananas comosus var. bracteatus TaxID=296719 RepID=A0A6V7P3T7_ANACO|nr:unnamed protein product [Ananas comosus var. bracteatus]
MATRTIFGARARVPPSPLNPIPDRRNPNGKPLSLPTRRSNGVDRVSLVACAVRFRPCIDIHKGKVKQIVGSTLRDTVVDGTALVTNFESDKSPAEFANLYKEDGLTGAML